VYVGDPLREPLDDLEVVALAIGDVAGVQAEVDQRGVGVGQEAFDPDLGVDVGVHVRVEDQPHAVLFVDEPRQLVGTRDEVLPLLGSMSPACVAAPVCGSVYCSGRCTRYRAPSTASSFASRPNASIAAARASLPLCRPAKTVPPQTVSSRRASSSLSRAGSCGMKPCGPSSV
jgi:hypothetical protein